MDIIRLFDILDHTAGLYPDLYALHVKRSGKWEHITYGEYRKKTEELSLGLIGLGIEKGDKVASITSNRPEWNYLDMALARIGAVHVPLFPNFSSSGFSYILNHADVRAVFTGNRLYFEMVQKLKSQLPKLQFVFSFDRSEDNEKLVNLGLDIENGGGRQLLLEREGAVMPSDPVSIYFTSGTTGFPKGAVVSHSNIVQVVLSMTEIYTLKAGSDVLSYLPLSHSFESAHSYMYQFGGCSIWFAENTASVVANMQEVKPYMFLSVPFLLDRICTSIVEQGNLNKGYKKLLFNWAYRLAMKYNPDQKGSVLYMLQLAIAEKLVFCHWKKMMGGKVKIISAGGASLPEYFLKLFWVMGINVLEQYGLTETYCVSLSSLKYGFKFGTVGVPEKNVEVKLADDGEILCRSPYVIEGYYKQAEITASVIDGERWFHTGDLGEFVDGKYLKIIGRKSSTFKTSAGNFIIPENIEKLLRQNPVIKHVMIVGKDKNFLSALIVPNFDYIRQRTETTSSLDENPVNLINESRIINEIQQALDTYNNKCWETELIQ
jgi:long-chain acyl-CoA synthetase